MWRLVDKRTAHPGVGVDLGLGARVGGSLIATVLHLPLCLPQNNSAESITANLCLLHRLSTPAPVLHLCSSGSRPDLMQDVF